MNIFQIHYIFDQLDAHLKPAQKHTKQLKQVWQKICIVKDTRTILQSNWSQTQTMETKQLIAS